MAQSKGPTPGADSSVGGDSRGVDVVAVVIAAVIVILLLLWCSRRKSSEKVQKKEVLVTETVTETVKKDVSAKPKEVKEKPVVNEVVEETMTTKKTKVMFAETKRTESLFQLMQEEALEEVAKQVSSLDEVSAIMHKAGLEHCNLIFGIDYTGSNYLQGKKTFGGKCLHDINEKIQNPYQCVISTLGETLEPFASDGVIPAFGFGDAYTKDHSVFSLRPESIPSGFKEVLQIYNELTPKVRLGGPTNFAPLINQAIDIVKATSKFHILVIVADGQVTNERATTEAIVEASKHPLSIITVGVGDGPWDTMHDFDEKLPKRNFDNFHFVDYARVTSGVDNPGAAFAIQALAEIPEQFREIKRLSLL